jgi:drug/metabolite transporter (DMT)-like permease
LSSRTLSKTFTKVLQISPEFGVILGVLATSTASPMIRYAQRDANSLVIAALRLSFAAMILFPFAFINHRTEIRSIGKKQLAFLGLSGLFLALHFGTWITSLEYTTVASSVVLVATTPLWVVLLSPFFLKEQLSSKIWIGLAVALLGGAVVGISQSCQLSVAGITCQEIINLVKGRSFFGNFLALAGAWSMAGYLIIGRKYRPSLSLVSYTFLVYGSAAIILLITVGFTGEALVGYSPTLYMFCLGLALVPQLLGHSTFNWALKYVSAAFVSVATLGEPIGSSILAYFLLDETPYLLEIIGGVLILAGIYLVARFDEQ